MAVTNIQPIDRDAVREVPFATVMVISVVFHVVVLVVLPLLSSMMSRRVKFERPRTFQLVMPNPAQMKQLSKPVQKQRMVQRESKPEPRPAPSKDPVAKKTVDTKPSPQKDAAGPTENLDELASLLDELPSPVQASAVGAFKYPWYINNIIQKVERYWTPSTENRKISIKVSFTVSRDGTASDIRIVESSGNSSLDNLAIRAVTLASPFGRMPPAFADDRLELQMTLYPYRN
jgi:TonB family protein